jgi:hypothetical protein
MLRITQRIDPLKARATLIIIFSAYIAFVLGGLGFGKLTEYDDFSEAAEAHAAISASFTIIVVGAYLALALVLIGGLPIAYAAIKQAWRARQWRTILLFGVPPLSLAVWSAWVVLLGNLIPQNAPVGGSIHSPLNITLFLSIATLFALAAVASVTAVSRAILRSTIPGKLYQFALIPGILAALVMAVVVAAMLAWGLSLWSAAPSLFTGDDGILATSTALSWAGDLIIMAPAAIVACLALFRAFPKPPAIKESLA